MCSTFFPPFLAFCILYITVSAAALGGREGGGRERGREGEREGGREGEDIENRSKVGGSPTS